MDFLDLHPTFAERGFSEVVRQKSYETSSYALEAAVGAPVAVAVGEQGELGADAVGVGAGAYAAPAGGDEGGGGVNGAAVAVRPVALEEAGVVVDVPGRRAGEAAPLVAVAVGRGAVGVLVDGAVLGGFSGVGVYVGDGPGSAPPSWEALAAVAASIAAARAAISTIVVFIFIRFSPALCL